MTAAKRASETQTRVANNGLTKEELGEMITHVAFYAGWPAAVSASSIAREVFK